MESVFVVCIIVLGGMGSIPGAIVGALVIQGVPELIRGMASSGLLQSLTGIRVSAEAQSAISNYRYLVFGALMVIMMAWKPQGILPSKRRARELLPDSEAALDESNQTLYDAQHDTAKPGEDL
jgi:branched-chain amino acid transport system permease protein